LFPDRFKLLVPLFENLLGLAVQFISGCDVTDGAVKPDRIVMFDILCHKPPSVVKRKRGLRSDAFWIIKAEPDNRLLLPVFKPEISRDGGIMLVDFSVSFEPVVKLAFADRDPGDKARDRNLGFSAPEVGEIDDGVTRIMGNPDAD
jgi:hypothetical protein